ncbi:hypothetical protein IIU_06650 [Bacillus cereus VD133]|uniref:Uncharacterized protein n=1 Tax=Bacillus cereus VD133 TaxID=1053233 RepID=A0A9W5UZ36_BACCE|nr:hypothetical protein IIU_06650 [Bacillus cereus VD133]
MKPVIYLHIVSFIWILLIILYLPNTIVYLKFRHSPWRFLIVDSVVLIPIFIFIFIASLFSAFSLRRK